MNIIITGCPTGSIFLFISGFVVSVPMKRICVPNYHIQIPNDVCANNVNDIWYYDDIPYWF